MDHSHKYNAHHAHPYFPKLSQARLFGATIAHSVPINAEVKMSNFGSSSVYCFSSTGPESLDSPIEIWITENALSIVAKFAETF